MGWGGRACRLLWLGLWRGLLSCKFESAFRLLLILFFSILFFLAILLLSFVLHVLGFFLPCSSVVVRFDLHRVLDPSLAQLGIAPYFFPPFCINPLFSIIVIHQINQLL